MTMLNFVILVSGLGNILTNAQRKKHVNISSKYRLDMIITYLLRCVFAGILCHYLQIHVRDIRNIVDSQNDRKYTVKRRTSGYEIILSENLSRGI